MDILRKINNKEDVSSIIKESDLDRDVVNGKRLLHLLASRGEVKVIKSILKRFPNVNLFMTDSDGDTLFHHLLRNGVYDMDLIKQHRESLWKINNDKVPALRLSIDNISLFRKLLPLVKDRSYVMTYRSTDGTSIITDIMDRSVTNNNYLSLLDEIVKDYVDVNDRSNTELFYYCITSNNSIAFGRLLKRTKNVNIKGESGIPLISFAVLHNSADIVDMLCRREDLNVNVVGAENRFIPMNMALLHKNEKIIRNLMAHDPDMNIKDRFHNTIVHNFVSHWRPNPKRSDIPIDIVLDIVSKGDINVKNFRDDTPLHVMARNSTIKYLYNTIKDKNPDMTALNIDGESVFSLANVKDIEDIAHLTAINYTLSISDGDNTDNVSRPESRDSDDRSEKNHGLFNSDIVHSMIYTLQFIREFNDLEIPYQTNDRDKRTFDTWKIKMYKNSLIDHQETLWNLVDLYNGMMYSIMPHVILWRSTDQHYIDDKMVLCIRRSLRSKRRFIMIKLTVIPNSLTTHANTILYDKKLNKVIRFEPYGVNDIVDGDELDSEIERVFEEAVQKKVKYVRPEDYLSNFQWQTLSHDSEADKKILGDPLGYCLAWCFWFISLKMRDPDMDERELMEREFNKIEKKDTNIGNSYLIHVRTFSAKLDRMKNEFMEEIGVPHLAKYHTTYTNDNLNKILDGIKDGLKGTIPR